MQELVRDVSGIETSPDQVQEDYMQLPFSVSYVAGRGTSEMISGTTKAAGGKKEEHHTIITEIHLDRMLLGSAVDDALDLHEDVINVLVRNINLDETVDSVEQPIRHSFGRLDWGAKENAHVGWRYEIPVKLITNVPAA